MRRLSELSRAVSEGDRSARHAVTRHVFQPLLDAANELTVDESLSNGTHRNRLFPNECFKKAFDYVSAHDLPDMRLTHGLVLLSGDHGDPPIGHAWVTITASVVFDDVVQRFFSRRSYLRVMRARSLVTLTRREAVERLLAERCYGPWFDADEFARARRRTQED